MNLTVNVLLRELEAFNGIVIFATNLAANFDPAFERRIRTHVLFEMPGVEERAQIWKLQIHPKKTPLAQDIDFQLLAERYVMSGGDIKNAVIKGAVAAAAEPGMTSEKKIWQRHFEAAIEEVIAARTIMRQSVFTDERIALPDQISNWRRLEPSWQAAIIIALALACSAFLASLVAVTLAYIR
jgi:ATP-dependent Zn protease